MTFTQAIRSGFANYVNFSGRALPSEFWWWQLFTLLVAFAGGMIDGAFDLNADGHRGSVGSRGPAPWSRGLGAPAARSRHERLVALRPDDPVCRPCALDRLVHPGGHARHITASVPIRGTGTSACTNKADRFIAGKQIQQIDQRFAARRFQVRDRATGSAWRHRAPPQAAFHEIRCGRCGSRACRFVACRARRLRRAI